MNEANRGPSITRRRWPSAEPRSGPSWVLLLVVALATLTACSKTDDGKSSSDIAPALEITTNGLPEGQIGRTYQVSLEVQGGQAPYGWSAVEGSLPEGITLAADGAMEGMPTQSGTFSITLEVTDSSTPPQTNSKAYTLLVPHVILLSGYGPFSGYPVNPSWQSVAPLDGERFGAFEVRSFKLDVVWDVASAEFIDRFDEDFPTMAIGSGVAGSRQEFFSLEQTARNIEYGTDVEGHSRQGTPCVEGGPDTLPSTLPLDEIATALDAASVPWDYSDSAGTYLCNHLFYELLYATQGTDIAAGFIHLSDANATTEELTAGWRVILQAIADHHGNE